MRFLAIFGSVVVLFAAAPAWAAHGYALWGDLKYPPNFTSFGYVNPNAPKDQSVWVLLNRGEATGQVNFPLPAAPLGAVSEPPLALSAPPLALLAPPLAGAFVLEPQARRLEMLIRKPKLRSRE